jgi:hypothetical protein
VVIAGKSPSQCDYSGNYIKPINKKLLRYGINCFTNKIKDNPSRKRGTPAAGCR